MDNSFSTISKIIESRRSVKPFVMNGKKIPAEQIMSLLELADWAPTHAYTEPWRFIVFENPNEFCRQHADLYKVNNPGEKFNPATWDKLLNQGGKASHVIIAAMKRGDLPNIPPIEEIAAASCAVQNILLGATASGIASFWNSGGMSLKPAFREFFGFGEDDQVLGVLYLGYADQYPEGKRIIPLKDKIQWINA